MSRVTRTTIYEPIDPLPAQQLIGRQRRTVRRNQPAPPLPQRQSSLKELWETPKTERAVRESEGEDDYTEKKRKAKPSTQRKQKSSKNLEKTESQPTYTQAVRSFSSNSDDTLQRLVDDDVDGGSDVQDGPKPKKRRISREASASRSANKTKIVDVNTEVEDEYVEPEPRIPRTSREVPSATKPRSARKINIATADSDAEDEYAEPTSKKRRTSRASQSAKKPATAKKAKSKLPGKTDRQPTFTQAIKSAPMKRAKRKSGMAFEVWADFETQNDPKETPMQRVTRKRAARGPLPDLTNLVPSPQQRYDRDTGYESRLRVHEETDWEVPESSSQPAAVPAALKVEEPGTDDENVLPSAQSTPKSKWEKVIPSSQSPASVGLSTGRSARFVDRDAERSPLKERDANAVSRLKQQTRVGDESQVMAAKMLGLFETQPRDKVGQSGAHGLHQTLTPPRSQRPATLKRVRSTIPDSTETEDEVELAEEGETDTANVTPATPMQGLQHDVIGALGLQGQESENEGALDAMPPPPRTQRPPTLMKVTTIQDSQVDDEDWNLDDAAFQGGDLDEMWQKAPEHDEPEVGDESRVVVGEPGQHDENPVTKEAQAGDDEVNAESMPVEEIHADHDHGQSVAAVAGSEAGGSAEIEDANVDHRVNEEAIKEHMAEDTEIAEADVEVTEPDQNSNASNQRCDGDAELEEAGDCQSEKSSNAKHEHIVMQGVLWQDEHTNLEHDQSSASVSRPDTRNLGKDRDIDIVHSSHQAENDKLVEHDREISEDNMTVVTDRDRGVDVTDLVHGQNVHDGSIVVVEPGHETNDDGAYSDDEVEEDGTEDDGEEWLEATYNPVDTALDRDAARFFQTQTQAPAAERHGDAEGDDVDDDDDFIDIDDAMVANDAAAHQLSQELSDAVERVPSSQPAERRGADAAPLVEDSQPFATARSSISAKDPAGTAAAEPPEDEERVPSSPPPPTQHLRPSQISTVAPTQMSPARPGSRREMVDTQLTFHSPQRRTQQTGWQDYTRHTVQTQASLNSPQRKTQSGWRGDETLSSSPLPLPPWSSPGRVDQNDVRSCKGKANGYDYMESLVDFSLPPPPPISSSRAGTQSLGGNSSPVR